MADENTFENTTDLGAGESRNVAGFRVLAQYVRDLSFENPHAPESLRGETPPKIDLDVELGARNRDDGLFEVDLTLKTSARRNGETVFHVEMVYGGLFQIEGIPADDMEAFLLIECPRYLFPFARRLMADLTTEGGFPPFRLDPIDFASIYVARRNQIQAGSQNA